MIEHEFAFVPGMPAARVVELAQRAEDLGYSTLYLPDQTFHRDPFALLALCAHATHRIRLGLAVTNPYTRHPIQVARAAGLLAEVSEGRFILGYGTGNRSRVLAGFGLEQTHAVARVSEAVDVVRRLLRGVEVEYTSPTLRVSGVRLDFEVPFDVPIYIASRGARLLALAGRIADGAIFEGLFTPPGVEYARGEIEKGRAGSGRTAGTPRMVSWQGVAIDESGDAPRRPEYRRWAALLMSTTHDSVLHALGFSEDVIGPVREDVRRHGVDAAGLGLSAADVQRLVMVGRPDEVVGRVDELRRSNVDAVAALALGDYDRVRDTMIAFAGLVCREGAGIRA